MISDTQVFISWFLSELPDFLLAEPICYFVGFFFLFITIGLFKKITKKG